MSTQLEALDAFVRDGSACARIEVVLARGSTPRAKGAWMLVSQNRTFLTIGGGQLEYMAINEARKLIASDNFEPKQTKVPLGPQIGQCCGGTVELLLRLCDDKLIAACRDELKAEMKERPDVYIFGAGHVGNAIAKALKLLPVRPVLVDTRQTELANAPVGVETRLVSIPEAEVRSAKPGSAFVILTHDHSLDFLIASEALARDDAAYVGMIGSKTKRASFAKWLDREGTKPDGIKHLVCPIGGNAVADKRPQVIAALAASEIITTLDHFGNSGHAKVAITDEPLTAGQAEPVDLALQK